MQNKLQELTDKIYQEGIVKGNDEADKIISQAKSKAEDIIAKAKTDAESIIAAAKKESEELSKNMQAELQLNLRQAVNALKLKITELIQGEITSKPVSGAFKDQDFITELIITIAKNWSSDSASGDLAVILPTDKVSEVNNYISKKSKDLLDKGLKVFAGATITTGFEIGPKDGSYKISITEKDFENYLKEYISPRIIKLLFV